MLFFSYKNIIGHFNFVPLLFGCGFENITVDRAKEQKKIRLLVVSVYLDGVLRIGSWIWEVSFLRLFLLACWKNVVSGKAKTEPAPLHDIKAAGRGTEIDLIKTSKLVFTLKGMYPMQKK